jgi:hypothetical protein
MAGFRRVILELIIVALLCLFVGILGNLIGNGLFYGRIQSTFGLVGNSPPNTCGALKTLSLIAIILGICVPGFSGIVVGSIIISKTYASDCNSNAVAFLNSYSTSPDLQSTWNNTLIANGISPDGLWQSSTFFADWISVRCSQPHAMNQAFVALVVIGLVAAPILWMIGKCLGAERD